MGDDEVGELGGGSGARFAGPQVLSVDPRRQTETRVLIGRAAISSNSARSAGLRARKAALAPAGSRSSRASDATGGVNSAARSSR